MFLYHVQGWNRGWVRRGAGISLIGAYQLGWFCSTAWGGPMLDFRVNPAFGALAALNSSPALAFCLIMLLLYRQFSRAAFSVSSLASLSSSPLSFPSFLNTHHHLPPISHHSYREHLLHSCLLFSLFFFFFFSPLSYISFSSTLSYKPPLLLFFSPLLASPSLIISLFFHCSLSLRASRPLAGGRLGRFCFFCWR